MKIAVGMSGGLDSAMAAWLLSREGHEILGVTMRLTQPMPSSAPDAPRADGGCFGPGSEEAPAKAARLCARLGIAHLVIDLAPDFKRRVLDPFRESYLAGLTPNPCVRCNAAIKFGLLPLCAREAGIDFERFATGHYARLERDGATGRVRLLRGVDPRKDQSYFLSRLSQEQLRDVVFPLGGMLKTDVAALARANGFADLADGGESQDFIAPGNEAMLFGEADSRPGPVVDTSGRLFGTHPGLVHCTVGQRQGLGIAAGEKMYVKELRASDNTVVVGRREEVFCDSCALREAVWTSGMPPSDGARFIARLRYRHAGTMSTLRFDSDGSPLLAFDEPQFAVAPGQAAVLYDGDEVIGSGWIAR